MITVLDEGEVSTTTASDGRYTLTGIDQNRLIFVRYSRTISTENLSAYSEISEVDEGMVGFPQPVDLASP